MVTIAVKRDFETQLIINKVSATQKDQSLKLKEGDLPSVMSPIYLPFISSSCTGEKKSTDKAYQVLLDHGPISTGHLLKDRDLIMTNRTNPIYNQPQHLIKMESKTGDVFANFFLVTGFSNGKIIPLPFLVENGVIFPCLLIFSN